MMMKRFFAFLITLCLCFCAATAETVYPLTVTDAAGRRVTLSVEPERIVSGYYLSTSLLLALGAGERTVGIEAKAETRPIYALAAPEFLQFPSVGTAKSFSLETCLALEPDLVILPFKLKAAAENLEMLGVPVLLVDPESGAKLRETVSLLGEALNLRERAESLLAWMEEKTALLQSFETAERPRVFLAGNSAYLRTAGSGMYQDTLIRLAGGENVAADLPGADWCTISYEQLLAWDPDVIVLASDASYTVSDILSDELLNSVRAVRENRVYALPSFVEAWDSPVPGTLLGSLWLLSKLRPECYTETEFWRDAKAFYQEFYHIELE